MRLDARTPGFPHGRYFVFDVPAAREVKNVVWIDTETAEFGAYTGAGLMDWEICVHKRKKIELVGNTFLLDPIEDGGSEGSEIIPVMLDIGIEQLIARDMLAFMDLAERQWMKRNAIKGNGQ